MVLDVRRTPRRPDPLEMREEDPRLTRVESPDELQEMRSVEGIGVWVFVLLAFFLFVIGIWNWREHADFLTELAIEASTEPELIEPPVIEFGVELIEYEADKEFEILESGFAASEPDGSWIVAPEAVISFKAGEERQMRLTVRLLPFVAEGTEQREVTFDSSGGLLTVALKNEINTVMIDLDDAAVQRVILRCSSFDTPSSLGLGADSRSLCAKLVGAQVDF